MLNLEKTFLENDYKGELPVIANTPFRTAYDGLQKEVSDLTGIAAPADEPSLAKQSEADACDINNIMAQFEKTGTLTHFNTFQGQYGDLGDASSYHESLNIVVEAQHAFDTLPAHIRTRFANDPAQFLDFVQNPDNASEMVKLGLLDASDLPATPVADEALKAIPKARKSKSLDDVDVTINDE